MIRLTRLNQQVVAVNPDNILWADQNPDTGGAPFFVSTGATTVGRGIGGGLSATVALGSALGASLTTGAGSLRPPAGRSEIVISVAWVVCITNERSTFS